MHYLGFAENTHDSCMTVASETEVLVHLEFERLLGAKRARVSHANAVLSAASLLLGEVGVDDELTLVTSRHTAERLHNEVPEALSAQFPIASVVDVEHFEAHAAFGALAAADALVLVMDGGGDRLIEFGRPNAEVFAFACGQSRRLGNLFSGDDTGIDGRSWSIVAHRLFGDIHAAGKVMGLAAYGDPGRYKSLVEGKREEFLRWGYSGDQLAEIARTLPGETFDESADLAAALQHVFTQDVITALRRFRTDATTLVVSGGCGLNVLTNTVLAQELGFTECIVPPCPGDEGQSLGAVLHAVQQSGGALALPGLPFLGRGPGHEEIPQSAYDEVAHLLDSGHVVAFHAGRAEIGPRALGHRSLLAMPNQSNRDRVSIGIKRREPFRPVAPILRAADARHWFAEFPPSPYMSFSAVALDHTRECAPGVVHIDGTARVQTVSPGTSLHLDRLFESLTRYADSPMLINTSLNVGGRPIAQDYADTLRIFVETEVDSALVGGRVLRKR